MEFPDIYCCIGDTCIKMIPIKIRNTLSKEENPYVFNIKILKRGNYIPYKLNNILIARSLCLLKEG